MPTQVLVMLNRPSAEMPPHDPDAAPHRFADPAVPQLSVLDLGATRGDGIFETLSVGFGRPQAFEHHLRRFASSAQSLDLPAPDPAAWRDAVLAAIAALDPADEAWAKIVMTRGIEGAQLPTGWVYAAHSPDFTRERSEGVAVVLLDRGYRHDVQGTSPWLLAGAKTLSYAINRAALREAARRGADDVVFVSSDGYLLEGPSSTLVYRRGDTLYSPGTGLGILDGTTLANVFRFARERALGTAFELGGPDRLGEADAAWLVSSVRLAAPIRSVDGAGLPVDREFTGALNSWLRVLAV